MAKERWGALSVRDHTSADTLVPELLLYDRLIMPVWVPEGDREEWHSPLWNKDLQRERLVQLGDLVVQRPWNEVRRELYKSRLDEIRSMLEDAGDMVEEVRRELGYQLTRRILADETPQGLGTGGGRPEVVPAYPSKAALEADFPLDFKVKDAPHMAMLIGQRLATPVDRDPEEVLAKTIKLVRSDTFRKKRNSLYRWQRQILAQGLSPEEAVEELERLVDEYNDAVGEATGQVNYRFAFLIGGVVLTLAAAPGSVLAGASALLSVIGFAALDRLPSVQAGDAAPAAVFHDVESTVGLPFRGKGVV